MKNLTTDSTLPADCLADSEYQPVHFWFAAAAEAQICKDRLDWDDAVPGWDRTLERPTDPIAGIVDRSRLLVDWGFRPDIFGDGRS